MPADRPGRRGVLVAAGVAAAILLALALLAYATADVVDEGRLLPYTTADAKKVEIFGGVEVTIQDEPPSMADSLGSGIFLGLAAMALLALLALARSGAPRVVTWFWGVLALGSAFLGLDEVLGFHETIGANLRFLGDIPGVNSPEDVVIALYAIPAGAFLYVFRDRLTSSRQGLVLIAAGILLYVAAAALDVLDAFLDEQPVELASAAALFLGFLTFAVRDLERPPAREVSAAPRQASEAAREPSEAGVLR